MKLISNILHIPLDLETRNASTPKYNFLHFPYFQPPKESGVLSLNTPGPSDVVPLASPSRLISLNVYNLLNVTNDDPSCNNNQTFWENRPSWAPGGRQGVYPLSWYASSCSTLLNITFSIMCSLFLFLCFSFLIMYMRCEHYLPCILHCTKKIYLTYLLTCLLSS
jgi:hypothetical protein